MDFEELISSVAEERDWAIEEKGENRLVTVPCPGERMQNVLISLDKDLAGQPLLRYWSVIGAFDNLGVAELKKCLTINTRLAYGAMAMIEDKLVIVGTQLLIDADPGEVASAIQSIAHYADGFEKHLLKGVDQN